MISIPTILDALVEGMRSIPDLIYDVSGQPENIYAFTGQMMLQYRSLEEAVSQMTEPSILVAYDSSELPERRNWKHRFHVIFKATTLDSDHVGASGYWNMLQHLVDGKPYDGCITWMEAEPLPELEPPSEVEVGRVSSEDGIEQLRISFCLQEK